VHPLKIFKDDLNRRDWEYQESHFPDWQNYFERPYAEDGRPPVFRCDEAWRNVTIDPQADLTEINRLLALIPSPDRHRWFRSMNSSQALAQSILGNLAIRGLLHRLAELRDDGDALLREADASPGNFQMERKVAHLREPRQTSLDGYISGHYRVAIECKFTGAEVGACSRPHLRPGDPSFECQRCDGDY